MVVNIDNRPVVRSQYWRQVRRIAPKYLEDRESELADLVAFCTAPDGSGPVYAWWRAPAWAGKSALMAWFALRPPEGVRIVAFFITSRWDGQSDRIGFTDVVIEQLAEILAEPLPAHLTAATRDVEFLSLLERAAEACAGLGQRLVLLVDGLDEDRGVTTGPDAYSIAALLPDQPPAGMRVIVAGRLNPPIPSDVDTGHPLCDPAIVRVLSSSPVAKVVQDSMRRELATLLRGSRAERELVGLIATARGGLSATDLAELTTDDELSASEVGQLLASVAGRSFVPRPSRWQPDTGPEVYVLGHEELQVAAEAHLGVKGAEHYRRRLCAWADDYRDRGWPLRTPEYLLRGYLRMLQSTRDLPRLVALATDKRRHARMRQVTGSDSLALAEIGATQQVLMAADPPDITAVARLAVHHQSLVRRGGELPMGLPAVWARIGAERVQEKDVTRAKEIARSFTDPTRRCTELLAAADALAARYVYDERALAFAADALTAARGISEPGARAPALAHVARTCAKLVPIDQVTAILDEARAAACNVGDQDRRESVLVEIAGAAAASGQPDVALDLAQSVTTAKLRAHAFTRAAESAAGTGDLNGMDSFLRSIDLLDQRAWALGAVTSALCRAGRGTEAEVRALVDRAEAAAGDIPDFKWRAEMLGAVAYAMAVAGETRRARDFIDAATAAARKVTPASGSAKPDLPISIACALVILGHIDDALRIARSGANSGGLVAVVAQLARAGLPDEAETLAEEINAPAPGSAAREAARGFLADIARGMDRSDVLPRLAALGALARIAADGGDTDRAIRLCERIESATTTDAVRFLDETTPTALAEALATAGYIDRALALAGACDPGERKAALTGVARSARYAERAEVLTAVRSWAEEEQVAAGLAMVAETAARAGDAALAIALGEEAVALAMRVDSLGQLAQLPVLAVVARTMAVIDEPEHACSIAGLITDDSFRRFAHLAAVIAAAEAGRLDSAHHIARAVDDPGERAGALARVAEAAVRAGQSDRARALAIASSAEPPGKVRVSTAAAVSHSGQDFAVQAFTIPSRSEDSRPEVSALIAEVFAAIGDQAQARATADATLAVARSIFPPRYKSSALSHAALAMAACGDIDQALSIAEEAMTAAKDIRSWRKQNAAERTAMQARGSIASAVAKNGDLATASAITESITEDDIRVEVLTDMARDLASSGDESNAVEIAHSIGDPLEQAKALVAIAKAVTGPRAQVLIGQALQIGNWEPCLTTLAKITPAAVAAIADEVSLLS